LSWLKAWKFLKGTFFTFAQIYKETSLACLYVFAHLSNRFNNYEKIQQELIINYLKSGKNQAAKFL